MTEWEWPRIRCEILVERESQKAMVIGKGGENLKKAGTAVRRQLPDGAFVELFVKVEEELAAAPRVGCRTGLLTDFVVAEFLQESGDVIAVFGASHRRQR